MLSTTVFLLSYITSILSHQSTRNLMMTDLIFPINYLVYKFTLYHPHVITEVDGFTFCHPHCLHTNYIILRFIPYELILLILRHCLGASDLLTVCLVYDKVVPSQLVFSDIYDAWLQLGIGPQRAKMSACVCWGDKHNMLICESIHIDLSIQSSVLINACYLLYGTVIYDSSDPCPIWILHATGKCFFFQFQRQGRT